MCEHYISTKRECMSLCLVLGTVRSAKLYCDGGTNHTELLMKIMLCWLVTPDPSAVCPASIRTVVLRQLPTSSCETKSRPVAQHRWY